MTHPLQRKGRAQSRSKRRLAIGLGLASLVAVVAVSAGSGAMSVGWRDILSAPFGSGSTAGERVFFHLRAPRVVGSVFAGASLGLAGASTQGLFRNVLADPSLIGVSAGATVGAVACLALLGGGATVATVSLAAFLGAAICVALVWRLGQKGSATSVATVLLAGVALNALAGAITGVLISIADAQALRSITYWTLGSLAGLGWPQTAALGGALGLAAVLLAGQGKPLDAWSLGTQEAQHLGVDTRRLTVRVVGAAALAVGVSVATCGLIAFVGLVAPHLARMLTGARHSSLLWVSALYGGVLTAAADLLARSVAIPLELPLSAVTSLVGAPFFLWLLRRHLATTS